MHRFIITGLVALFIFARLSATESFLETVKPSDFAAAGLGKLSADELTRLGALIEAYKGNNLAAEKQGAVAVAVAPLASEPQPAPTASKEQTAKAKGKANSSSAASSPAPAKVTLMPGTKVEYATNKSVIPGKFNGWDGHTVFVLENGQRWQVANGDNYFTPTVENVEVEIIPSKLGGYWMNFPLLGIRVRVKLLGNR